MALWVGTSGYAYPEWRGSFYPEKMQTTKMLPYYAERFPTVEINNTFYRMPNAKILEGWSAQVPEHFRLTLKAPQRITHQKRLRDCADEVKYFLEVAQTLGPKLGAILFQTPPYLRMNLEVLDGFLEMLPAGLCAAFEFRHPSWMEADVFSRLQGEGTGAVHRRQRKVLDAGRDHRRLRVFPPARRRLPAGRHRALGADHSRADRGQQRGVRLLQARRGGHRHRVREAADQAAGLGEILVPGENIGGKSAVQHSSLLASLSLPLFCSRGTDYLGGNDCTWCSENDGRMTVRRARMLGFARSAATLLRARVGSARRPRCRSPCTQMARYGLGHGHETSLEHALPRTLQTFNKDARRPRNSTRRGKKLRQERCVSGAQGCESAFGAGGPMNSDSMMTATWSPTPRLLPAAGMPPVRP